MVRIKNQEWIELLQPQRANDWCKRLTDYVDQQYAEHVCYPNEDNIFRALDLCAPSQLKVVIVGQDPYHNVGQANGLCFSCVNGVLPPSLVNIYKEIRAEYPDSILQGGDLSCWARQGVLMLNTCLSVRAHEPNSHRGHGWEEFTKAILDIANRKSGVVFMLWGNPSQSLIGNSCRHSGNLYLTSAHPSPLSAYRGFFGNGHFIACNEFLRQLGQNTINWSVGV